MMDYQIAKQNIDHFLKIDEEEQKREQQNTGHRWEWADGNREGYCLPFFCFPDFPYPGSKDLWSFQSGNAPQALTKVSAQPARKDSSGELGDSPQQAETYCRTTGHCLPIPIMQDAPYLEKPNLWFDILHK